MNLGIIGYGNMGRILAQAIEDRKAGDVSLVAVLDVFADSPFGDGAGEPAYFTQIDPFLKTDMAVVVETASQAVLKEHGPRVVGAGKNLIAMSTGAFSDRAFLEKMSDLAVERGCRVMLPSGAIGGLDAILAAGVDQIDEVTLTTTKPPRALAGVDRDLDLATITEPTLLYEGPAGEAVVRFPKNVNVAATLSLAGIGFERTVVRLVADPHATLNTHRIDARGAFGELHLAFTNVPSPDNPKTSYLAALSAIRAVKNLTETFRIGG
ncbi:MAG: aspartate dehydrogenase [Elusimicrobia bacterium RBG_16_66_12]|nr:MAG: aspartate dehydrogenase [Elusimicrobia bacterium RBG_16_66_12]